MVPRDGIEKAVRKRHRKTTATVRELSKLVGCMAMFCLRDSASAGASTAVGDVMVRPDVVYNLIAVWLQP